MDPQHPPSRSQHPRLLEKYGAYCQGCGCDFTNNPSALEVDHIWPRSEGGTDAYENLTLLCPPCNRTKSDTMTITGLQQRNRREGILRPENEVHLKLGRGAKNKWRAAFAAVEELLAQEAPEEWAAYKAAEAQLARANPDKWEQYVVANWANKRSADARLKRKKAAYKEAQNLTLAYPDEWAAYKAKKEAAKKAYKTAYKEHESKKTEAAQKAKAYEAAQKAALDALKAYEVCDESNVFKKATLDTLKAEAEQKETAYRAAYEAYRLSAQMRSEEAALAQEAAYKAYKIAYKEEAQATAAYKAAYEEYESRYESRKVALKTSKVVLKAFEAASEEKAEAYRAAQKTEQEAAAQKVEALDAYEAASEEKVEYEAVYEEYEVKKANLKAAMKAAAPNEWAAYWVKKEVGMRVVWAVNDPDVLKAWTAALDALAATAPTMADAYFALQAAYQGRRRANERRLRHLRFPRARE